jgi:6-phosphogluconolactonase
MHGPSRENRPARDESYALDREFPLPPRLPGAVTVAPTADELIDRLAADLVVHSLNCVREFGDFHVALSGGQTPQPFYRRLMYDPNYRAIPWRRTHLWLVDERCVPFDDDRSNWKMIQETIVDHADIPAEQVHPIFATSPTADVEYEATIRDVLAWREKGHDRLDFALLGMGSDGHTASLFPHTEVLHETERLVRLCDGPRVTPPPRVSMTFPLINSSRLIAVLACGPEKSGTIRRVAGGHESVESLPIKGVRPLNGELRWYLDGDACARVGE